GGLVVLMLGCGMLWWLFGGGGGAGPLTQWVPGDAQGFVSVRVADLWNTDLAKQTLAKVKKEGSYPDPVEEMEKKTGLKPTDIERGTLVFQDTENMWVVIETVAAYDQEKVRKKIDGAEDITYKDRKYIKGNGD